MIALILPFLLIEGATAQCQCQPGGTWSEWVSDLTTCYDYCGGAGSTIRTRTCLNEITCPCPGNATETVTCDPSPCIYPRNFSCSYGKSLVVACGSFQCLGTGESPVCPPAPPPAVACECCPVGGIWGEWKDAGSCSDTCGACGKVNRTRNCLTTLYDCPCVGNGWELQPCNRAPCTNRTAECCTGFSKTTVNGTSSCTDAFPGVALTLAACCPSATGLWNDWSSWTTCSATCGLCGTRTRTRTCASSSYGCPCTGNSTQTQPCGGNACPGNTCCGTNVNVVTYDGANVCMPVQPKFSATPGSWTSWTAVTGRTCNDTCGAYGSVASYRLCLPIGSVCTGDFFGPAPCGFNVCLTPRASCNTGYVKTIDYTLNTFQCTPKVTAS